jgi:BolA protein
MRLRGLRGPLPLRRKADKAARNTQGDAMTLTDRSMTDRITAKLRDGLDPIELEVIDESDQHKGHGGWREGGETHFRVVVRAGAFTGLSRLDRHRRINALLADELAGRVHALAVVARAPGE